MKHSRIKYSPNSGQPKYGFWDAVISTPIVKLERFLDNSSVNFHVKLESHNPGGSVKNRPAKQMIKHALAGGEINRHSTIVEWSSGSMGIGLAQACRYYGLKFICVVDPNAQLQNICIIEALGGRIARVASMTNGSYFEARWARVKQLLAEVEKDDLAEGLNSASMVEDGVTAHCPDAFTSTQNATAETIGCASGGV